MKENDNIIENFIFDYILRREVIQEEVLNLSVFILSQKIENSFKEEIMSSIIWKWIIDENEEITEIISHYRKWIKIPKLYEWNRKKRFTYFYR